jgi:hypothetical protein
VKGGGRPGIAQERGYIRYCRLVVAVKCGVEEEKSTAKENVTFRSSVGNRTGKVRR